MMASALTMLAVQHRYIMFCHVPAHAWHPWNECPDSVAKAIALGRIVTDHDCHVNLSDLIANPQALQWLWLRRVNSEDACAWPKWEGSIMYLSVHQLVFDDLPHSVIYFSTQCVLDSKQKRVELKIGSANIRTTLAKKDDPLAVRAGGWIEMLKAHFH